MNARRLFGILVCVLCTTAVVAQGCLDYQKFNCGRSADGRFKINGQSRGAQMRFGQATELNIVLYRGQDYHIALCADNKVLAGRMHFRLLEKVRTPLRGASGADEPSYADERKVLWDNADHGMAQDLEFTCNSTRRLVVEVAVEGGNEGEAAGCVGILIEHMPTPLPEY
jgi:hypothetical protein